MNFDLIIDLLPFVIALGGAIWRIATVKAEIYTHIDKKIEILQTEFRGAIYKLEKKTDDLEHLEDRERLIINGKIDKANHRNLRLENAINDLNQYLEKTGEFRARRGLYHQDNE